MSSVESYDDSWWALPPEIEQFCEPDCGAQIELMEEARLLLMGRDAQSVAAAVTSTPEADEVVAELIAQGHDIPDSEAFTAELRQHAHEKVGELNKLIDANRTRRCELAASCIGVLTVEGKDTNGGNYTMSFCTAAGAHIQSQQ